MLKKAINLSLFILMPGIFIVPLTIWAGVYESDFVNFGDSNIDVFDNNIYAPPSSLYRQLSNPNIAFPVIRERLFREEAVSLDTPILFGMYVGGDKWKSRYTEFEQSQDLTLTEKKYFNIKIKGYGHREGTKGFVKIQLLDENTKEQEYPSNGTYAQPIELPIDEFSTISIALDKFKDAGADLSCIKRAVIHYGEEIWRTLLNAGGAANISINKGWFSETPQGEEPQEPPVSKKDDKWYGCFIGSSLTTDTSPR